jgi:hypothetical protein
LEESDALGVRFCGQGPVVRRTDQNEVGIAFGTPQFGDCLQAAEAGQVLVEQDENEIGGAHQRQRFSAFDRLGHLQRKTGRRQNLADDAAHNRRVVHQQQAARQPQPARALWAQRQRIVRRHRRAITSLSFRRHEICCGGAIWQRA